jgi:hypothetical protein|nr:MAG TPA: hypothetical protein [Caudoviricetes sp.]
MKDAQLELLYYIDDNYKNNLYNFQQDFKLHKLPAAIEELIKNLYTNILDLVDDYLDFQIEF